MTSHLEPSSVDGPPGKAPSRRHGVLRFQHQVSAIDDLLHAHDPNGVGDAEDAYDGVAVEVMRVLRDADRRGDDYAVAIRQIVPEAGPDLLAKIIVAWEEG